MTATTPLRIVVAINPAASFGRGRTIGPAVVQALRAAGHEVTALSESSYQELRTQTAAALAATPDALVVVGGDGMVSLGFNAAGRDRHSARHRPVRHW
jgi:diacylglycerol kinase (ATP)